MPLMIELDLRFSFSGEIMPFEFNPITSDQHVECVTGIGGDEIQVAISWSDLLW
uniref:Uncharacterized protein n=1 Tax=Leersia perrieri TaxID=77586 RepID=A0A0D9XPF4_9ORYZ